MTRFKFRLDSLLSLRKSERDQARRAVAEAVQAIDILEARIAEKDQEIRDVKAQLAARSSGELAVDQLLSHGRYEVLLTQEKQELVGQTKQIQGELEKRQSALMLADQEVKRIDKLRDRAVEKHADVESLRIQKDLDEAASTIFRNNSRQGQ